MLSRYVIYALVLVALTGVFARSQPDTSLARTLKTRRWQNRVVILYAPTAQQTAFRRQKQWLTNALAGVAERDIICIDTPDNQLSPANRTYLQSELDLPAGRFGVVLIGKDGEVKLRSAEPIPTERLFATIDGMSMRQQEMRERKHAKPPRKN